MQIAIGESSHEPREKSGETGARFAAVVHGRGTLGCRPARKKLDESNGVTCQAAI
jgi:hypothetical protein